MTPNPDLKEAFGNPDWTAVDLYREVMLELAADADYTLELGSGLTSLDLARAGVTGLAIEHLPEWIDYVQGAAAALKVGWGSFNVGFSPLTDYGDFEWYTHIPDQLIDFVVCDGPPRQTTKGQRIGALPRLFEALSNGCFVLFDDYYGHIDVDAPVPAKEITSWQDDFGVETVEIYTPTEGNPFALLKLP